MLYTNKSHKGGKIYRAGDYFCDAWRCTFLQISRGNVNMPQRFLSWLFLPQFVILPGFTKSRLVCLPDCMLSSPLYAKSQQSCPTLCDPVDRSPPGSSVPGILQTRILEWVDISFSTSSMLIYINTFVSIAFPIPDFHMNWITYYVGSWDWLLH